MATSIVDRFGRPLRSLRVSVTDRCNLRCHYCMPEVDYAWLPRDTLLTFEEITSLTRAFSEVGVDRVRITGGEPLLRRDILDIVRRASERGLWVVVGTNGVSITENLARRLSDAGARGLSMSTDKGATWSLRSDGLEARYCRAVVLYGDQVLVSASNGPRGGRAAVYRGGLEDGAFERCRSGLPEWFDDNIDTYCLDALNDGSFAAFGTNDGSVYVSDGGGTTWRELVTGLSPVRHLLVVPD